jgi:hypothetical protein
MNACQAESPERDYGSNIQQRKKFRQKKKEAGPVGETGPDVQGMNVSARKPGRNPLSSGKKGRRCAMSVSKILYSLC